jgi:hypothetical protein
VRAANGFVEATVDLAVGELSQVGLGEHHSEFVCDVLG